MKNLVAVLDLGSTKTVCLVAAQGDDGDVQVKAVGIAESKGVSKGVVTDLEEAARSVDAAIRNAQADFAGPYDDLVVSVSGAHIEAANSQGLVMIYPPSRSITREDVLQVINHSRQHVLPPDRSLIQSIPREFRIDGQKGIQKPIGMSGSKLEAITYLVSGLTTQLQNTEKAIEATGRKVEQLVLGSLASGLGVLTPEEIELGAAVVDIGGGKTDLGIFENGSIAYSATLPIGSGHVSSDISKLLKTSPEEAERLKRAHGAALGKLAGEKESVDVLQLGQTHARPLQRKVLCEIAESRMRETATMVWQQIERAGKSGLLPGGVVLTGGGSALPGTDRLFADVLKHTRVRVAEPHPSAGTNDAYGLATALGLARFAIQCFEDELAPASGDSGIRERIRTLWSLISGK